MKYLLSAVLILSLAGCGQATTTSPAGTTTTTTTTVSSNKPLILAAIGTASEIGTNQGLRALANKNLAAANETATTLQHSITTTLLPYFAGGKIGSSAEVQTLLNSSLLTGVDPTIKDAISAAAAVLDAYLPVPGATTILSQDEIDYITAFLNGVARGCVDYQPGRTPRSLSGRARWIEVSR